jgi:hypothetical protein
MLSGVTNFSTPLNLDISCLELVLNIPDTCTEKLSWRNLVNRKTIKANDSSNNLNNPVDQIYSNFGAKYYGFSQFLETKANARNSRSYNM